MSISRSCRRFLPIFLGAFYFLAGWAQADTPGSRTLLLMGDNVRQELKITKAQATAIDRLQSEYRREIVPFIERADARSLAMLQASTAAFDRRVTELLTPAQRDQLLRLEHRILGPWMLHTHSIQDELELSLDQRARIAAVAARVESYNQRLLRQVAEGRISLATRLQRLREYRQRQSQALLRILTKEQRAAWEQISKAV